MTEPKNKNTAKVTSKYSADSIEHLTIREQIRKRPSMWIGNNSAQGLHHLIHEIVDNSVDEYMAGHGELIEVEVQDDGWVRVRDYARGIPVDTHKKSGKSALELVLTEPGGGGKYGGEDSGYVVSGGLHGVGASIVNILSSEMTATVYRDGFEWHQAYTTGLATGPVTKGKKTKENGTEIAWKFDAEIFADGVQYERAIVERKLRETAYLSPGLRIKLIFQGQAEQGFYSERGLYDYMKDLVGAREAVKPIHKEPLAFSGSVVDAEAKEDDPSRITYIDVAMFWTDSQNESGHFYTNSIINPEGGTHYDGFRRGLRKALNDSAKELNKLKGKEAGFEQADTREGLFFAISVKVPEPHFEGQTKLKLNNVEVEKRVADFVSAEVTAWMTTKANRAQADNIIARVIESRDGRLAARKAKASVISDRGALGGSGGLPSKFANCSIRDRDKTEIFIVEGDSAGGQMKQARDRQYQAILPLKGKIMNAEKAGQKTLESEAVLDILNAIGGSIIPVRVEDPKKKGRKKTRLIVDTSKPRFGTVILCSDPDVDGGHITALLLTFFYRFSPELIRDGHVYVTKLPLYKIEHKKDGRKYLYTDDELESYVNKKEVKLIDGKPDVTRFKGLGEMSKEQLRETALDPETRRLERVRLEDIDQAEDITTILMGSRVDRRREYIEENALSVEVDI